MAVSFTKTTRKDGRLSGPVLVLEPHPRFTVKSTIGIGTFGAVFLAIDSETGGEVAIKKVYLDPRYKNRELDIVGQLHHPNCLCLHFSYTTTESAPPLVFQHLVTDYFPGSLSTLAPKIRGNPVRYLKIFGYQIFSGLCYLHAHGICHRDIKPSNILVDPNSGRLQLCDFGSAKTLKPTEFSVSYIATRSYRAPELLLDCTAYTTAIDIWAAGCVLTELLIGGKQFFTGGENSEVLISIVRTIGMPDSTDFASFAHKKNVLPPSGRVGKLADVLPKGTPRIFTDLLHRIFVYAPERRATAAECMAHPFFVECATGSLTLSNGSPLPEYFAQMQSPEEMLANFPNGP
jgi:glycogen synthase kinase 3 beta